MKDEGHHARRLFQNAEFKKPMNVLYDHQIFSSFAFGGVSRIFIELMNAYSHDPTINFKLSIQYSDNDYFKDSERNTRVRPYLKRISGGGRMTLPIRMAGNSIVNRVNSYRKYENRKYSEKIISEGQFDVFHPTYFDPYFLDYLHNKPFVLTVYDLIYELFPEYFLHSRKFLKGKSLLIQKAEKIIAISESTKTDLMKFYALPSEKIKVIYLANSLKQDIRLPLKSIADLKLPERYLLYVGNRGLYKNFLFFVESIAPFLSQDNTLSVLCAGGNDFTRTEKQMFRSWGIERKLHYSSVNDALLTSLYANALAFVFPSLYEGFGIPILEAFACNCPVLISNTSSLPEIAGGACLSFDPKDKISILDAVKQMLSNEFLRTEFRKKGKERVKFFSWEHTAEETKRIYESIA
jgi:glycosyltransferase involved in cell wall biosynthesis